jgi:AbrB family looped-hinge helix DNA binding protein
MSAVTLSSKGQLVLPAGIRQRFGLTTGSRLEVVEESNGIRLVVPVPVPLASVASGFGMLKAKSRGRPRRLDRFDAAGLLGKPSTSGKKK